MLNDREMIEKAVQQFKRENKNVIITEAFITEATDHTPIIILKDYYGVVANYEIRENNELKRLDK
jgi:hypothetical protein